MKGLVLAALIGLAAPAAEAATVTTTDVTTQLSSQPAPSGLFIRELRQITILTEAITEVLISGVGLYTDPDLDTAPGPLETGDAIAKAFNMLGLAETTPVGSLDLAPLVPGSTVVTQYGVGQTDDAVIIGILSDPTDLECASPDGLAIITGALTCRIAETTRSSQPYLLTVTLADPDPGGGTGGPGDPAVIPLPAAGWRLLAALGGPLAVRRP